MTTIESIGPQLDRAAAGTDPRGWLVFAWLPSDLQRLEDQRAFADYDEHPPRGFDRGSGDSSTMTEPSEPTPATESIGTEPDVDDVDESTHDPRVREAMKKLRSENHSLRTRLRDREEQLGASAAREAVHHRAAVERIAASAGLIDPSDIWAAQPDPGAFVDEQFQDVVSDKVVEVAKDLIRRKPHLAKPGAGPPPTDRPLESLRSGARAQESVTKPSWSTALRGGGA